MRESYWARFRALGVVPAIGTVIGVALLIALGTWQLGRADDKRALERTFAERAADAPIGLPSGRIDPEGLRYRRIQVTGRFDAARQFLLDNRTRRGVAGYHVLTPLRLEGDSRAILVNRGWVPGGPRRDVLPAIDASGERVVLEGLASLPTGDPFLLGPAGYEGASGWPRVVQSVDLERMEALLGYSLMPVVLRLAPESRHGFVREWRPYVGFGPERHQAYAVQWFALAAALASIYVVVGLSRRGR